MPVHKVASLNKLIHILSKVKIKTILLYCLQYSKAFELHQLLAKHKVTTHKVTTEVINKTLLFNMNMNKGPVILHYTIRSCYSHKKKLTAGSQLH